MTQVEAVYRGGKFEPLGPVDLQEEQRVTLRIEPGLKEQMDAWLKDVRAIQAQIVARSGFLSDSTALIAEDRMR
ncbi:MAG TPA: antitoxin family protein [Phycisphaerae bacterium]|nr:antitoxin family protein [Phycisphaerae bacterium]